MCGIAGIYWYGEPPADGSSMVDRMLAAIHHRGPDSDGRTSSCFAEVGFKRLSIIDLATGDQPMRNEDGTVECFLNGEIYNYLSLRKELLARGHVFRTSSDTEVLPHLYEELGEGMFLKLDGMFSICVIDHHRRMLLLARDHFGVKQMYHARTSRGVVFASEIKAILASGFIEPEIDEASILPYLALFYSPQPHTLLKGVSKLPQGSLLRLAGGSDVHPVQYYRLPLKVSGQKITTEEAARQSFDLLTESVKSQLQADVPVGISLSGGIDSSAITCLAGLAHNSRDPVALTINWPDSPPEEVACSKELCRKLGIASEVIEPPSGSFETDLPLLAWISDEPIADPATYSQFRIALAARQRVKVLLSGAGGDELFGGYGRYVLPWPKATYAALPTFAQRQLLQHAARHWTDPGRVEALMAYRSSRFLWHWRSMSNLGATEEALQRNLLPQSRTSESTFRTLFNTYREYCPVNQQMMVDLESYLPDQVLPMMDRATMAASVEGRVPFLDVRLVEFCASLSGKTKMGYPPRQKRLLKHAIAQMVPPQILKRRKSGMPSPFSSFITRNPKLLRAILLSPEGFVGTLFPRDWTKALLSSEAQIAQNFAVLYALVILEVWHRLFIKEKAFERPTMSLSDLCRIPRNCYAS